MSGENLSLEEDVPKPLLERPEENVFTPKISTPIYTGGENLHHKRSDAAETESFLSDSQRNEPAFQQLFQDGDFHEQVSQYGDGDFHEVATETESFLSDSQRNELAFQQLFQDADEDFDEVEWQSQEMADLHAMSVLSTYQDNLSRDMNTDRDGSDSSIYAAEEFGCGDPAIVPDAANDNGKPAANRCSDGSDASICAAEERGCGEHAKVPDAANDNGKPAANHCSDGSDASICAAEERGCGEHAKVPDAANDNGKPAANHCSDGSDASICAAEERGCGEHAKVPDAANDNGKPAANQCSDGSDASICAAEERGCGEHAKVPDAANDNGKPAANHCSVAMDGILNTSSLTFNDGVRSIDCVLVWEAGKKEANTSEAFEQRKIFEDNLEREGLQLEREAPEDLHGLNFVKIHVPLEVLKDYSEILKLRMPMKFSPLADEHEDTCWGKIMSMIRVDPEMFPERAHQLTAIFSKDKEYLFDTASDFFWTPSIRSRIVQFILDRKRFSNQDDEFALGIARLINNNTYSAAYPLHDGDLKTPGSMRHLLYTEWASVSKCLKFQPLDYVKDYFGVKIGLYFAWLGFYTHMLIPASVVGLICVIYSAATVYSNTPSEDVCNYSSPIKMCPLCDYFCEYWDLKDTCLQARVTYLFDNHTTVFFAIFMSFWAACFLELWKRYSAEITHRWDLTGFDIYEEHPRPQYLARLVHVKRTQLNVATGEREPMVPFWRMRLPATLMSFSVVALLVLLALATVLGVVLYRMSLLGASILRRNDKGLLTSNPIMFTTATAACINLVFICIFNYLYKYVAEWLTEKELLRTQTEFDDSLTLKIYLLQFVNYYASIFYIAFFKGKFVGRPGDYVRFFGHRQEECAPGGCLLELSIQLAIIMAGKQFYNTVVEMMTPNVLKWWNIKRTIGWKNRIKSPMQWVKDFKLVDFGNMGLFPEYMEMVLQYGFVTIFVAAFPLAPLFALINNVLEMRLDAKKFLTCYRRPVPQRVNDIGVWYRILDSIGKLSVITNGLIIAFTSDFIPRLVYQYQRGSLNQYLNHTLADFNITVLKHPPINTSYKEEICSYADYWHYKGGDDCAHTTWYWHVMGARLVFVVVFQDVVALVMIIVRWAMPDMLGELRDRIRRETFIVNRFIVEETRRRTLAERPSADATRN